jgi:uncharacterized protein (TIGR02246 family)
MNQTSRTLERCREAWIAAVCAADVEAYAEMVTNDVVWLAPGSDPVIGREAFRNWVTPFMSEFEYDFRLKDARARVCGGWAVEHGTFHSVMTTRDASGKRFEHSGPYMLFWRRDDNEMWRIERYADTTDLAISQI